MSHLGYKAEVSATRQPCRCVNHLLTSEVPSGFSKSNLLFVPQETYPVAVRLLENV
jgi:hypothetical protein